MTNERNDQSARECKPRPAGRGAVAIRKRGPKKGDGGRTPYALTSDPDRWIVVALLWLRQDAKDQTLINTIELLDLILTDHDCIGFELSAQRQDGTVQQIFGVTNQQPDRRISANSAARKPRAAPGGNAFRSSRIKTLKDKFVKYRRADRLGKLSPREKYWMECCRLALDFVVAGNVAQADLTLRHVGWEMNASARKRFENLASAKSADVLCRL